MILIWNCIKIPQDTKREYWIPGIGNKTKEKRHLEVDNSQTLKNFKKLVTSHLTEMNSDYRQSFINYLKSENDLEQSNINCSGDLVISNKLKVEVNADIVNEGEVKSISEINSDISKNISNDIMANMKEGGTKLENVLGDAFDSVDLLTEGLTQGFLNNKNTEDTQIYDNSIELILETVTEESFNEFINSNIVQETMNTLAAENEIEQSDLSARHCL